MIKIFYKSLKEKKLKLLKTLKAGAWIYVEEPTENELNTLCKTYGFDKGLLTDALDPYEVPRIEKEDELTYIFARYADSQEAEISTKPILFVVGDTFTATITQEKLSALKPFIKSKTEFSTTQKAKFLLQLLIATNNTYNKLVNGISKKIRGKGFRLEKITNKDIIEFVLYENILNDFLSALVPTNTTLEKLLAGRYVSLYEDDEDLVEDLSLNTEQLIEMCKAGLKSIVNVREAYTTLTTNELNRVMKLLTAITAILTIPTIVSGIYGMNVTLPLQNSPLAFFFIISGIILICLFLLIIFIRNRLL